MNIKDIKCFVFDMDGTIYMSERVIDGAFDLLELLKKRGTPFLFFTNNSSKSPDDYVQKLRRLGFLGIEREQILSSGDVLAHYVLNTYEKPKIYLAGTPALHEQMQTYGIECGNVGDMDVSAAVMGFDTTLDYEKINHFCTLVAGGVDFLATNIDNICPLDGGGFLPDCGSMCKMVTHSTGVEPKFVGKPFKETVDCILRVSGLPAHDIAMVGDRLYTDIATAVNGEMTGIAVLSGEITARDIEVSDIKPHITVNSVADIYAELMS